MKCFLLDPEGSEGAWGAPCSCLAMCTLLEYVDSGLCDLVCKPSFPPGMLQGDL